MDSATGHKTGCWGTMPTLRPFATQTPKDRGRSPPPCPRASRRPWLGVHAGCALRAMKASPEEEKTEEKKRRGRYGTAPPQAQGGGGHRGPRLAARAVLHALGLAPGVCPRFLVRAFLLFFGFSSFRGVALGGCVVVALSRCSGFVPVVRVVLRSARCRVAPWGGSALGLSFRRSRLSLSGFVAVARFGSFAAASRFALSWGRRLPARPGFCAVRAVAGGFAVSVPVCRCLPPCRSGLRALLAARSA